MSSSRRFLSPAEAGPEAAVDGLAEALAFRVDLGTLATGAGADRTGRARDARVDPYARPSNDTSGDVFDPYARPSDDTSGELFDTSDEAFNWFMAAHGEDPDLHETGHSTRAEVEQRKRENGIDLSKDDDADTASSGATATVKTEPAAAPVQTPEILADGFEWVPPFDGFHPYDSANDEGQQKVLIKERAGRRVRRDAPCRWIMIHPMLRGEHLLVSPSNWPPVNTIKTVNIKGSGVDESGTWFVCVTWIARSETGHSKECKAYVKKTHLFVADAPQ
jgi:hypothetical protein